MARGGEADRSAGVDAAKRKQLLASLKRRGNEVEHAFVRMLWVWDNPEFESFDLKVAEVNGIANVATRRARSVLAAAEIERRRRMVIFDMAVWDSRPLSVVWEHFEAAYEVYKDGFCVASSLIGIFANHLKVRPPSRIRARTAQRLLELSESGKSSRKTDAKWFGEASIRLKKLLKVSRD